MKVGCSTGSLLDRIISTLGELPASPAIVSTVMGLTSNPDSAVEKISQVLSADQSLTAKVLKLSNSSFYGRPKEVRTLQEAILLLGFFTVRSIVVATSAHTMYTSQTSGGSQEKLWQHSLAAAVAGRQLAKRLGFSDKDEVFVSALLHDIGKLVLLQKLPEKYLEVVTEVEGERASFVDVEARRLGFTHCDVAAVLFDQWQFPVSIRDAVVGHHQPPHPEDKKSLPACHLVCLGNHLAKMLDVGFADGRVEDMTSTDSAQLMALDDDVIAEIVQEAREYYQIETSIFEES